LYCNKHTKITATLKNNLFTDQPSLPLYKQQLSVLISLAYCLEIIPG